MNKVELMYWLTFTWQITQVTKGFWKSMWDNRAKSLKAANDPCNVYNCESHDQKQQVGHAQRYCMHALSWATGLHQVTAGSSGNGKAVCLTHWQVILYRVY
eukprot:scpid47913/ scgid24382/ 